MYSYSDPNRMDSMTVELRSALQRLSSHGFRSGADEIHGVMSELSALRRALSPDL